MNPDERPNTFTERVILKYHIPVQDEPTDVVMPWPSRIVHVDEQATAHVTFWAECENTANTQTRRFVVVGTGHSVSPGWEWRGTLMAPPFVWHLYEVRIPADEE